MGKVSELRTGHVLPVRGRSYDHFAVGREGTTSCCQVKTIALVAEPVPHARITVDDACIICVDLTGATWAMMPPTPQAPEVSHG